MPSAAAAGREQVPAVNASHNPIAETTDHTKPPPIQGNCTFLTIRGSTGHSTDHHSAHGPSRVLSRRETPNNSWISGRPDHPSPAFRVFRGLPQDVAMPVDDVLHDDRGQFSANQPTSHRPLSPPSRLTSGTLIIVTCTRRAWMIATGAVGAELPSGRRWAGHRVRRPSGVPYSYVRQGPVGCGVR